MAERMYIGKGHIFASETTEPIPVGGSMYRLELGEENYTNGELQPAFTVVEYRGTLVTRGWRMAGFADVQLDLDNGFSGNIRIFAVRPVDSGRSFVVDYVSCGRPITEPAEDKR
jgi:hypothetical protein